VRENFSGLFLADFADLISFFCRVDRVRDRDADWLLKKFRL
jgi:hypothetical protein